MSSKSSAKSTPYERVHVRERREASYKALQDQLQLDALWTEFIRQLQAVHDAPEHPFTALMAVLKEAPLEARYELDGWLKYARTRELMRLGRAVMRAMGEAQLTVAQRLMASQPF